MHVDAGLAVVREALDTARGQHEHWWDAELYRLQGSLLLCRASAQAEAERAFQQALSIARKQHARSLELRAATSLARLWQAHGRRKDARRLLEPTYAWFSEGFDTPDLREAAALLVELC